MVFSNSRATYSYGAIIVPEAVKDLLQTLGEQRDVDLLASETLNSASQASDAISVNFGQLLYFHLYAHNAPIISPYQRANIGAKLRSYANDEKKITVLNRCMPRQLLIAELPPPLPLRQISQHYILERQIPAKRKESPSFRLLRHYRPRRGENKAPHR